MQIEKTRFLRLGIEIDSQKSLLCGQSFDGLNLPSVIQIMRGDAGD